MGKVDGADMLAANAAMPFDGRFPAAIPSCGGQLLGGDSDAFVVQSPVGIVRLRCVMVPGCSTLCMGGFAISHSSARNEGFETSAPNPCRG